MKHVFLVLTLFLASVASAAAAGFTLRGTVTAKAGGTPVEFATVSVTPSGKSTVTDDGGHFALSLPEGSYTVKVSFVGYRTAQVKVSLHTDRSITVQLDDNSKVLSEVVVTAKESTGMTSSSRIDRDAMSHLQPTSFTDLLELLPGNISKTPNMGSANTITLRETGALTATGGTSNSNDYSISSLGTLFMVDGAPINGDANMQHIPGSGDATSPESKRDITNKGVDMRTISTDNIESVEIVRGIPSAEYGNLTSGMVNIKRIRRATPLTARFKADEYSKLVSIGKGFNLGNSNHIVNLDGGFLDSKVDPRNNLENYKRVNLSGRLNFRFNYAAVETAWITGIDYTGSFDNAKDDPDLNHNAIDEYKSSYNRINYTSDLTFKFPKLSWLSSVNLNTSVSYQHDRLERHKDVAPQRASVAPSSMDEGVHDGHYLLSGYLADFVSDGKPVNIFAKLKAEGSATGGKVKNEYKLGGDFTLSKNYGDGQVYDLSKPMSAGWSTRPRAYKDIPALNVLSLYAENMLTAPLGNCKLSLQTGLRSIQLVGLNSRYSLSGKAYLDPRLNAKFDFPSTSIAGHKFTTFLAAGYGLTTKMPTISYLFPQVQYTDFIQLNYYNVYHPAELSRISLRTYIDDVTNYQLKPARNHKWELRFGATIGKNSLSVTYFNEKMTSGFRYSSFYKPYSYTKYDASGITADQAQNMTTPIDLATLPSTPVKELSGYSMAANGSRLDKEGIEFVFSSARWQPLATALTITGAWFHSTYTNSQMLFDPVSDVVNNAPVRNSYIGYYNMNDGRVNDQFNTNFMFDTQIKRWGLIFSTSIQCMWFVTTKKLWQNGTPDFYLDVADGQLHPYTDDMKHDETLQFLVQSYNADTYRRQTTPMAMYVNLKATKEIGKHLRIAVFANRMLDYLPDYKSNGLMVRRVTNPYFGMELNFSL